MEYEAQETGFRKFMKGKFAPYVGLIIAFALGLLFLYFGIYSVMCGSFLLGIVLYIIPKTFGADWKKLTVFGVIFLVAGSAFGAYAISNPFFLDHEDGQEGLVIKDVSVDPFRGDGGTYTFTARYTLGAENSDEMYMKLEYAVVDMAYMHSVAPQDFQNGGVSNDPAANATHTFVVDGLEDGKMYIFRFLLVTSVDADGNEDGWRSGLFVGPVSADDSQLSMLTLKGNLYFVGLYVMLIFFLIVIFTTWMRRSFEKTRDRMESEGRLYPQGYGRCKSCGTIVLPGEVVCRKCGEYIDIPDEYKPKKVDYFVCSECGKEVPSDAKQCPVCGEVFDDEVVEVFDPNEQEFVCSSCGKKVPKDAKKCPSCGKEFEDE